jgi:Transcriptional regulatory protein, C terminal
MKTQQLTTFRPMKTPALSRMSGPRPHAAVRTGRSGAGSVASIAHARTPEKEGSPVQLGLVPAVFLDTSARARMVDSKEIWQLSRFAPVVVFAPKRSKESQSRQWEIVANFTTDATEAEISGLLEKAAERQNPPDPAHESAFGAVSLNFPERVACRHGEPIELTTMEFKALQYLIQNARRVISRDELLNQVWGYENDTCTRTVDNHILRLRQKLEQEPSRPVHFRTVHGVGYKFLP